VVRCTFQTALFRKKVTGVRELLNEEIYHSYSTTNKGRWVEPEKRNTYRILVQKSGAKRPTGRTTHRWEDNIKLDPKSTGHK